MNIDANEGLKLDGPPKAQRVRLPDDRQSRTHKFTIQMENGGKLDGYLTVGFYGDGSPGEIFIHVSKIGSTEQGLLDNLALAVSIALQHGVPLSTFVEKYTHQQFEPSGMTENPEIRFAKSLPDYVFQWLGQKFCGTPVRNPRQQGGQSDGTGS